MNVLNLECGAAVVNIAQCGRTIENADKYIIYIDIGNVLFTLKITFYFFFETCSEH